MFTLEDGELLPISVDMTKADASKNMPKECEAINVLNKSVTKQEAKCEDGYYLPAI